MTPSIWAVLGIVAFDFYFRWTDRKERDTLKTELKTAQAGLAELHNKNAAAMQELKDKVSKHDMVLNARTAR